MTTVEEKEYMKDDKSSDELKTEDNTSESKDNTSESKHNTAESKKPYEKPSMASMLNADKKDISDQWQKINKTNKLIKLKTFADEYSVANDLTEEEKEILLTFLKDSIDKKKLHRVKDVVYDKASGTIKDIPGLTYVKNKKHFTLRIINEKRVSTLKSLGPKRNNDTKSKEL
jgi:hypothetical protein